MRRWWVTLALLVSLGVNLGLLGAIAAGRWAEREARSIETVRPALPGAGRELGQPIAVELPDGAEGEGAAPGKTEKPPQPPPRPAASAEPEGPTETSSPSAGREEPATPQLGEPGDRPRSRRHRVGRGPHDRHAGDHRPGEPPLGRLADHLGLEGERRERFVALQRRFLDGQVGRRREGARLGAELRAELVADQPDRARVEELLARLAATHAASERATAEVILESRGLLDREQQRRYVRVLEHLREGSIRHGHRPPP